MSFDIEGARKEGYTDTEIISHLTRNRKFDVTGARKEGYSDTEIAEHLAGIGQVQTEEHPLSTSSTPESLVNKLTKPLMTGQEIGQTISNIPSSAYGIARDIGTAIAHPIQTAQGIGQIYSEAVGQTMPSQMAEPTPALNAMKDFFINRYGSPENIKQTIINDPVGFAMDLSGVLSGTGALTGAKTVSNIGKAIEPINVAGKVVRPVGKLIGKTGLELLGVTTGTGAETIKQAAINTPEFVKAMRGGISGEEIVTGAKNAVDSVKEMRAQDYVGRLKQIAKSTKELDITPIKSNMENWLKKYNVKRTSEGLDFSRSAVGKSSHQDIADVVNTIDSWGTKVGDNTPIMLDTLKRQLDDFYYEAKSSRAMVADLKNTVRNTISKEMPEYLAMTKNYEKTSGMINELNKALSLKEGVSTDTALRKLTTSMRESFEFRRDLIKYLEDASGQNIQAQIAGFQMKQLLPRGGLGKILGAGELSFLGLIHPQFIPILLANSPRAVGEFLTQLKKPIGIAKKITETGVAGQATRQATFQAGRIKNTQSTE